MGPVDENPDKTIDFDALTDQEFFDLYGIPRQDSYSCISCHKTAYPPNGSVDHFDLDAAYIEFIGDRDLPDIVCFECIESGDWEERALANLNADEAPTAANVGGSIRSSISSLWSTGTAPPSFLGEQWLFLRRLGLVLGGMLLTLTGLIFFGGGSLWLLISPATGLAWITGLVNPIEASIRAVLARPDLVLAAIGLAYLAHLDSIYRGATNPPETKPHTRPRWHYLAGSAIVGGIGGLGWALIVLGHLQSSLLPLAVLLWSGGAVGLLYGLHTTLLEDRWSYGLRRRSHFWKFPVQYGVALTVYDGLVGLHLTPGLVRTVALIPPVVGLGYVVHRHLTFSTTRIGLGVSAVHRMLPVRFGFLNGFERLMRSILSATPSKRDPPGSSSTSESVADLETEVVRLRAQLDSDSADPHRPSTIRYADLFRLKADLDRALDSEESLLEGVAQIARQLDELLAREGIEAIETTGPANPLEHTVVDTIATTACAAGEIVEVYRPGFRLGDRVLQEAHVAVAAEPAEES